LLKYFQEAHDMAQRRAQIVGDDIAERFQFLIGGLQVRGVFDDALLLFRVENAELLRAGVWPESSGADG
jgi:hypothetical protein